MRVIASRASMTIWLSPISNGGIGAKLFPWFNAISTCSAASCSLSPSQVKTTTVLNVGMFLLCVGDDVPLRERHLQRLLALDVGRNLAAVMVVRETLGERLLGDRADERGGFDGALLDLVGNP